MADAESITFTSDAAPRRRHDASTASRGSARSAPNDRMIVTEWEPGRAMGIEHRGVVTGTRPLHARPAARATARGSPGPRSSTFPWWMGGPVGALAAKPVLRAVWRRNLRAASTARLVGGIPRMTNRAVSVAGLQTLGAPTVARRRARSRRARLRVGVGRGGERGRGDVAARRDQPGRAARRPRHRRARAAAAHAAAARDGRPRRCSSSRATATCSSASASRRPRSPGQWHGAGYTDRPIAQVREFVTLLRECLSRRDRHASKATSTR